MASYVTVAAGERAWRVCDSVPRYGASVAYVYHCRKSCGAQMVPGIGDDGLRFLNAVNLMQKFWREGCQKVAENAVSPGTMIKEFKEKGKKKGHSKLAHRMVAEQRADLVYGDGAEEPCEPPPLAAPQTRDLMRHTLSKGVPALPTTSTLKKLVQLLSSEPDLVRWTDDTLQGVGGHDPSFVVLDAEALGKKWGGSKGGKQGLKGFHRALNMFSNLFIRSPLEEVSASNQCNGQHFGR